MMNMVDRTNEFLVDKHKKVVILCISIAGNKTSTVVSFFFLLLLLLGVCVCVVPIVRAGNKKRSSVTDSFRKVEKRA